MRPSGFRDVTFSYRLEAGDGTIELEIENNAHSAAAANVLLWLVIEEPIGQAETVPPLRTGLPLFVIGLEHHVPKAYFAYEASCNRRAGQLLRGAIEHAVASGFPIPEPDPRGETYPAYVHRVIQEVGRG